MASPVLSKARSPRLPHTSLSSPATPGNRSTASVAPPVATWLVQKARERFHSAELDAWVSQQSQRCQLDAFNVRAPHLLYAAYEWLLQNGALSMVQRDVLSSALTAERFLHSQAEALASRSRMGIDRAPKIELADERAAFGAIAAYWSCQVAVAASMEAALSRLDASKEVLHWKQCHSAHSARCLMRWTASSPLLTAQRLGSDHPAAVGAELMVDAYCGSLLQCLLARDSWPNLRSVAPNARSLPCAEYGHPWVLAG